MTGNTTEDSSNRKVTIFRTLWLEHHCVRDFVTRNVVKMIEVLFFWPLVFEYLEPEDLVIVNVSSVCLARWWFVFQGCKSTTKALHHCPQLHLADTGKQYWNIPLRYFSELTWINLSRTMISSSDFLKLVGTAKHLEMGNIESCSRISEEVIFKAKRFLPCLRRINISFNDQSSVLAVACLCSCSSLRDIRARGIRLQAKELLLLTRTFPRLGNGRLTLDIGFEGGDYFVDAIDALSDFDLFKKDSPSSGFKFIAM